MTKKSTTAPETDTKENLKVVSKMRNDTLHQVEEKLWPGEQKNLENLIHAIESAGIQEFMEYIRSPWKMIFPNLIAGIARWIGTLIGAALVIAIIGWILATIIDLPLIGKQLEPYVNNVQSEIQKYTEATNYKNNFRDIENILAEIRDDLKKNPE